MIMRFILKIGGDCNMITTEEPPLERKKTGLMIPSMGAKSMHRYVLLQIVPKSD